jgi:glycerol-3-phosphate dehydrogenase
MASRYFTRVVTPADVVWSYAGVRPLLEDESADLSAVTRDYVLEYDAGPDRAPLLSVFGGKITTYRRLAEEAMDLLGRGLDRFRPTWTAGVALPGGDIAHANFEEFLSGLRLQRPALPDGLMRRYARAYGTRTQRLLGDAKTTADLGEHYGDGLYEAEVDYLTRNEWALTTDDILWRRSKLGLHVGTPTVQRLTARLGSTAKKERIAEVRHAARA